MTSTSDLRGGRVRVSRSRGATSGLLLILLGAWGALIPLIGPYVDFAFAPDRAWDVTAGRAWLEVLPGVVVVLGGLILLTGSDRISTSLGGWLGVAGGIWFLIGPTLRPLLHLGTIGLPLRDSTAGQALIELALFTGLGAAILLVSALAVGRLSVVAVRDVHSARRRAERQETARLAEERDAATAREATARDATARDATARDASARDAAARDADTTTLPDDVDAARGSRSRRWGRHSED